MNGAGGGGGQKRVDGAAAPGGPPAAKRARTTKAQELHDAVTKQQIAQRHAKGGSFDAVPTFTGAKTRAASTRAPPRPAPLTPVHRYNFRQHTPPPTRLRPGHSNSIVAASTQPPPGPTAKLSALASRLRVALPPDAVEQTVCPPPPLFCYVLVVSPFFLPPRVDTGTYPSHGRQAPAHRGEALWRRRPCRCCCRACCRGCCRVLCDRSSPGGRRGHEPALFVLTPHPSLFCVRVLMFRFLSLCRVCARQCGGSWRT